MLVASRVRPRKPHLAVVATCLSVLLLAGCASPGAPAPTEAPVAPSITATPSATPSSAATPTPTPTPSPGPVATVTPSVAAPAPTEEPASPPVNEVPDGWQTVTVDDWAQFNVPAGWTVGKNPTHVAESTDRYLIDPAGNLRVRVSFEMPGEAMNPGKCEPTAPWFKVLDTTPLPGAHPGEELAQSTHVQQISLYGTGGEITRYEVNSTIHELDRMADECVPEFVVYPESGGYYTVALNAEPQEDLHFATKEEAEAYTQTDEYLESKKVIQSFHYVG